MIVKPGSGNQVVDYADSYWGLDQEKNRKSRTGVPVKFGDAPILTTSIRQKSISISSTKAEYNALAEATMMFA